MADETVAASVQAAPVAQAAPVVQPIQPVQPATTVKPSAIGQDGLTNEQRMKNLNISDLPYHTHETEQKAKAAKDNKADKPYVFKANGYTVVEKEYPAVGELPAKTLYVATADGFERAFTDKRSAEIYVTTHAPFIKA